RIEVAVDRRIALPRHKSERIGRNQDLAVAVLEDVKIVDDTPLRKMRDFLHQFTHWQTTQVDNLDAVFIRPERLSCRALPVDIKGGLAYHNVDVPGVWMELQSKVERRCQIELDRHTNDIGWQRAGLEFLLIDGTEDDRHAREDHVPIFQHEIQPGGN